jgi:hypothetical protein
MSDASILQPGTAQVMSPGIGHNGGPPLIRRESDAIVEIYGALVQFQGEVQNPPRDREVEVRSKSGGSYKFKYATLGSIMNTIRKPMADAGLAVIQIITYEPRPWLTTRIIHKSGQWISCEMPLEDGGGPQAFGSQLTYMRRYSVNTILCLASDEDDDANIYEGNQFRDYDAERAALERDMAQQQPPPEPPQEARRPTGRTPASAPPSATKEDATFRKLVAAFNSALKNAADPAEADKFWLGDVELRGKMSPATLAFVTTTYRETWHREPPADQPEHQAAAE